MQIPYTSSLRLSQSKPFRIQQADQIYVGMKYWQQCCVRCKVRFLFFYANSSYFSKRHAPTGWSRPLGRLRRTWVQQIGDGSISSLLHEWNLAHRSRPLTPHDEIGATSHCSSGDLMMIKQVQMRIIPLTLWCTLTSMHYYTLALIKCSVLWCWRSCDKSLSLYQKRA